MNKDTELIFNLFIMKFNDDYYVELKTYPRDEFNYNLCLRHAEFKMLKDCFPENEICVMYFGSPTVTFNEIRNFGLEVL